MIQFLLFALLVGLFVFGMYLLRTGLYRLSGERVYKWLSSLTNSTWKGFLLGILVTAIVQSSSAVMILTIGLVSAGMLTFPRSIGIILGTNVGTTFTAELLAFDIEHYAIPMALAGAILGWVPRPVIRHLGLALLGLSAIFGAMWGFETLAAPLKNMESVHALLLSLEHHTFYALLAGIVLTALIQSSTATTGIMMGFLSAGTMPLHTGIAVILGANIGTCVDALVASFVSGREGRLAAYAHMWLNVLGVALFYPFIGLLAELGERLSTQPDTQLAHASVIFNVVVSLLVLPFADAFGRWILRIHGR